MDLQITYEKIRAHAKTMKQFAAATVSQIDLVAGELNLKVVVD